jgi:starch-binding outer membrane protein, SusD/RagB family
MKKIRNTFFFIAAVTFFSLLSCSKDFIDLQPKGSFLTANYYKDQSQAYSALVGVYDVLHKNTGGFESMLGLMNSACDDQVAGGGGATDGLQFQVFTNWTATQFTVADSYWSDYYQGIFRASTLLSKLPNTVMDESLKARYTAETKALRAYCYFNLEILFKNIPLILDPVSAADMYNIVQAKPEEIYAQLEKDLTEAIPDLPNTVSTTEYGRFTKGAAQAMLGKVYLYEGKNAEAAAQLAEVNGTPGGTSQYGYKLLDNFSDLWVVANKFNSESILETSHTNQGLSGWGNWGSGSDEGDSYCVLVGPRGYVRKAAPAPYLPSGWSFNVFTQEFYDAIKTDPRFTATVFDMKALAAAGKAEYIEGYMNTGYFFKKLMPTQADVTTLGGDAVLNYKQDSYIIRLADTYLMEAEALGATGARAQALLDAVRARVGLASVPVSMAAIKAERRFELAGEGFRFFDLVRWGDAASNAVLLARGFTPGKNEIFPIPNPELLGTKIVQNPGYNQ